MRARVENVDVLGWNKSKGIQTHNCICGQHEFGVEPDESWLQPEQDNRGA